MIQHPIIPARKCMTLVPSEEVLTLGNLRITVRSALVIVLSTLAAAQAENPPKPKSTTEVHSVEAKGQHSGEATSLSHGSHLPVRRVVLYKNGVGYFEHSGRVQGNQALSIDFTTAQLNDVLKSLTVLDLGNGQITGVRYNSIAPLSQRLHALHLPFNEQTTRADFLWSLRGTRVEVRSGTTTSSGRLLSVERVKKQNPGSYEITETTQISVMNDSGELRSYELTPGVSVRIVEAGLNEEIGRYFKLLESARGEDLRRMTISTAGDGKRDLFVSYISEVPVWKSTYRIILPSSTQEKPLLQGWAIVDNTVGEDWNDVQLSLIAGEPQSFVQQISQPYYLRRPVVELPESVLLAPQTHEGSMIGGAAEPSSLGNIHGAVTDSTGSVVSGAKVTIKNLDTGVSQETTTSATGAYSFMNATAGNSTLLAQAPGFNRFSSGSFYLNSGRDYEIDPKLTVGSATQTVEVTATAPILQTSASASAVARGGVARKTAPPPAEPQIMALAAQTAPQALGFEAGDLFEYKIHQKITIGKDQSALVPIVQSRIEAEKVTLWNDSNSYPLRGLWINNTSGLTLDGGTFNVVEADTFAGEGLLAEIRPAEKRIISYAVDPGVRISARQESSDRPVTRVQVAKGILKMTSEQRTSKTYVVHNSDTSDRTVILEYPARADWKLASGIKPEESSSSFYRFRANVGAGKTTELAIEEFRPLETVYEIKELNEDQITLFASQKTITPEIEKVLREVLTRKAGISSLEDQSNQREHEMEQIGTDQARLRENMKALKGSAEEKELLRRYTGQLNTQEDRLSTLRKEIADLQAKKEAAEDELDQKLAKIAMDENF